MGKSISRAQHQKAKRRLPKSKRVKSRLKAAGKLLLQDLFAQEKGYDPRTGEIVSEPSIASCSEAGDASS